MTDKPLYEQLVEIGASKPEAWESLDRVTIERELELIDGMIEVQLHHARQCDGIANRAMAEKQKGWDMERVALLRKMRAALAAQPAEPCMDTVLRNAARRSATIVDRGRMVQPVEPVALTDSYVQQVPDKCDRITWRNRYYSLPPTHAAAEPVARVRVHMTGGNAGIAWSAVPTDDAPLMRDGDLLYLAPPAPAAVPHPSPELTWLFTHCRAIGMIERSDSGKWEHDIALFTTRMQDELHELKQSSAPAAVPPGYALVPIKPTPEMIASGAVALVKASHSDIDPTMEEVAAAYRAMIAAGDKP